MRFAFVLDPLDSLKAYKDSSIAMMRAAQAAGHAVWAIQQPAIHWSVLHGVCAEAVHLELLEDDADWYAEIVRHVVPLRDFAAVVMRKDPPFDMEYIYTTYILEIAEQRGLLVVNKPASLRDINEKAYTAWFAHCTPPSLITRSRSAIKEFLAEQRKVVLKPLDGMGGKSIFVVADGDPNTNVILETLTDYGGKYTLVQRYIPEITAGDKRILLIDGEPVEYALARIPAPGDPRGNLVMGATGEGRPLSQRDRWLCAQIGPALSSKGIVFAGLDVIGDYLTEINVTSPTGIRELDRQYGLDIAAMLIAAVERRLSS
jgi:glutathione synthase